MKREPRMKKSAKPRKITPAQIRAAWTLYQHGLSINDIARQSWQALGYASRRTCEESIRTAFNRLGYETRSTSQARRLIWAREGCAGCGVHKNERTRGCATCTSRHYQREERGEGDFIPIDRSCAGCGCDPDNKTFACRQCIDRHSKRRADRRRRELRRPVRFGAAPAQSSTGSGHPLGGGTPSKRKVAA